VERPTIVNIAVDLNGTVQQLLATPKTFSSGSEGYHAVGKLIDPKSGEKYQANVMLIRIGSKPDAPKTSKKK